jgi:RNA methyltransferase, TrmH family
MLTSPDNSRVKLIRGLQSQRKTREKEGRCVIEGTRLVEEAVFSDCPLEFVFYSNPDQRAQALLDRLDKQNVPTVEVSQQIMRACSDTETPQPLLAVLPFPIIEPHGNALLLVCDQLSDPGNLGTLLRTAAAASVDAVILAPGTVDAYNPKVLRSAMGAHFRVPVESLTWEQMPQRLNGLKIWLAEASEGVRYDEVDWTQPSAIIVGGEAEGPSPQSRALAHNSVFIPMPGGSESLNAAIAGSVILFEAVRQLLLPK